MPPKGDTAPNIHGQGTVTPANENDVSRWVAACLGFFSSPEP